MSVTYARGFAASGVASGISTIPGKPDLALVVNTGSLDTAAAVFTANRFAAAPVQWSRRAVADGHVKAVVLNSGGANACTGRPGLQQSRSTAQTAATLLGVDPLNIAVASTGLIGELLPLDSLLEGLRRAHASLEATASGGMRAAHAIMTTDTRPKIVQLDGDGYRIGGMVKGSGMIAPQLATMLCVITTDAVVDAGLARQALTAGVEKSFNRIDVDGCMSTNDTVLLMASGASGVTPDADTFSQIVVRACASLARSIVGDGEGSSHDIRIEVRGAGSESAALACARAIAASNLLKCAVAGNDPNWGRVLSSLGTVPESSAAFQPDDVAVTINGVRVFDGGRPAQARSLVDMTPREVHIDIDLRAGDAHAVVWTDDLTLDYVHINSEYAS